jgi:hypothetical protein
MDAATAAFVMKDRLELDIKKMLIDE